MIFVVGNACWFQSRTKPVRTLLTLAAKEGVDLDVGITEEALDGILAKIPSSAAWVVKKAGGAQAIMKRCDLDGDGFVRVYELVQESECLNSCWKQVAISTFL